MKKLIVSVLFLSFLSTFSFTQSSDEIAGKVASAVSRLYMGGDFNYNKMTGDFSNYAKDGISFNAWMGLRIKENFDLSVSYGYLQNKVIKNDQQGEIDGLEVYGSRILLLKGWYFLTGPDNPLRPYIGLGIGGGVFTEPDIIIADPTISESVIVKGQKSTGLAGNVEVGLNFKGFKLSYNYNLSGKAPSAPVSNLNIKNLGIHSHSFGIGYNWYFMQD